MALKLFSTAPVNPDEVSPTKLKVFLGIAIAIIVCAIVLSFLNNRNNNDNTTTNNVNQPVTNTSANINSL